MSEKDNYYIVQKEALPEVLVKVLEVKKLLECEENVKIAEAVKTVGISRSSFYKYKDMILPFYENAREKAITIGMKIDDKAGFLSEILLLIASYNMSIMTINQTLPINNVADLTFTISVTSESGEIRDLISDLKNKKSVYKVKILARE